MKRIDYTGQKFGHLTIIEMLHGYGKHGEAYCRCICECGNEVIKSSYGIRNSRYPAHCGCMTQFYKLDQSHKSRVDLVGKKFGRLTVVEMIYKDNDYTKVRCKCDCGNEIIRIATYLTSGETQSCGCYQKQRTSESNVKDFTGIVSSHGIEMLSQDCKNDRGVWLWKCKCHCGNIFTALPANIIGGHIASCGCISKSSGEILISNILDRNKIKYETEYKFYDCKDIRSLPFDFYLPSYKTVIEYQGRQHYASIEWFGGEEQYKKQVHHDNIKREYCKINNINLIEIPYTMPNDKIEQLIQTLFIRRDCNGLCGNI